MGHLPTLLIVWATLVRSTLSGAGSCPSVCICKWKGGKQTVECTDRALITIPDGVDSETQVLDVSGNNLQILPREVFVRTGLLNLQRLYLRACRLGQIDDRALAGLTNLVELDLSNNLLTSVPTATFNHVPFLRDLLLGRNPIQKIESHAFKPLPGLVKLDLSNCAIHTVSPKAFEGVELLEALKLNGNQLHELRPRTVETLSRLHGVELHDNPWYCDCHLRAVKLWLIDHNIPYPVPPMCSGGPDRIARRSFSDLDLEDFACKPEIRPDSRRVEASAGENATVVCRVESVPEATVNWYSNGRLLVNNSAYSSYQRVVMLESGTFEKKSTLIVTNAQESDSGDFYCIAENRAGNAEANYTVRVAYRMAGMASLGSGQIAGLSAALVLLILCILLVILVLLVRLRRPDYPESKTPGGAEAQIVANGTVPQSDTVKPPLVERPKEPPESTATSTRGGAIPQPPPRSTSPGRPPLPAPSCLIDPAASNPDLISGTGRPGSGEYTPASIWDSSDRTPIVEDYPPDYGLPIPCTTGNGVPPPSAKTLRVWQRGVPVLPPVNALKRVLSRSSPDEGYQEGCGTDV